MKNEEKLKRLFDFQKFEQNEKLAKIINGAGFDSFELSDDELSFVNAAGVQSEHLSKLQIQRRA